MVGRDLMALLRSVIALDLVIFLTVIAHWEVAVALNDLSNTASGDDDSKQDNAYLEILLPATITSRDSPVGGGRQGSVFTLSAVCPRTVVACGKNPITLRRRVSEGLKWGESGNREAYLEVVQTAVITTWLSPSTFPLRLTSHEDFWVGYPNGELVVLAGITGRVRDLRRVGHCKIDVQRAR